MAIEITGRHVSITESMRDYASKKVQNAVADFAEVENVHVILDVQKYRQIAEVVVQGRQHLRLEAREVSDDMYASIDTLMDKIERQLMKTHQKHVGKRDHTRITDIERKLAKEDGKE